MHVCWGDPIFIEEIKHLNQFFLFPYMSLLWNRSIIYTKIYTYLHCFGSRFTLKSVWATTHYRLHIFCSDIYGNLQLRGWANYGGWPTWTNQWKICCRFLVMQVWTIKYVSINTSRNQLPDQRTRRWSTFVHPNSTPPRTHFLFTQNITHVYTCINVPHNRADAHAPLARLNHARDHYPGWSFPCLSKGLGFHYIYIISSKQRLPTDIYNCRQQRKLRFK
jgi:hypothetical protein